jgi:hypothetical protein
MRRTIQEISQEDNLIPIYFDKPPLNENNFVYTVAITLFNRGVLKKPFTRLFTSTKDYASSFTFNRLQEEIRDSIKDNQKIVLMCDEAHLGDEGGNLHLFKTLFDDKKLHAKLILAGYESGGVSLKERLSLTYSDRIGKQIIINGLSKDQLKELILKRLEYRCGDQAPAKAFQEIIDLVCIDAGRRPRKALRLMDMLLEKAAKEQIDKLTVNDYNSVKKAYSQEDETPTDQKKVDEFEQQRETLPPEWTKIPNYMHNISKFIASSKEPVGVPDISEALGFDEATVRTYLNRMLFKDARLAVKLREANFLAPLVKQIPKKVKGKRYKLYILSEQYKSEFVKE